MTRALAEVAEPGTRLTATAVVQWPVIVVFAALPSVGLLEGPSYAGFVFGLGILQLVAVVWLERRLPVIDRPLALLAAAFVAWCWASVGWSVDPGLSTASASQVTAIFAGCLIFLAAPRLGGEAADRLFRVMFVATLAGGLIFIADKAAGFPLQSLLMGRSHAAVATKYNRGIDHLAIMVWPQLAFFVQRRDWRQALLLASGVAIVEGIGLSLAGQVGTMAGITVLLLSWLLPRLAMPIIAAGTALFVIGQPLMLRLIAEDRMAFAGYLKASGLHRLEIWDFMTARTLEQPLLGWGFGAASRVPITPDELSHFVIQHDQGIYPHDQWLGLWVETGAPGAAIGLGFALVVLWRIQRIAATIRPFGYATFASAMAIASVNFEAKTDSWWAALAASAYLLMTLNASTIEARTRPHAVVPAEPA
jgi:O-antigen ligase